MDSRSIALLHGLIVTMDRDRRIIEDGGVLIEGDTITAVGKAEEVESSYSFDLKLDVKGKIVLPGLIDSHRHLYGILTRGMPVRKVPSSFISFLEDLWWPFVENRLDKDMIYAAALASGLEAIKNGTTCIADILEAPFAIPGALEVEARAMEELGLRAILSFEATERVSEENGELGVKENLDFIRSRRGDALIRGMFCVHTTFTCSPELLKEVRELANREGAGIHMHLEEGAYETMYCLVKYRKLPVQFYDEIGFLGPDVLAAQCVHTRPEERRIMAERGVKVSHEPLSNCEVGGGIAPVPEMIEEGLVVGLGTDGYIVDEFEVMRAAFLIHKGRLRDPRVMPAEKVLEMATIDNARALGMDHLIGSIEPGKKADILILDYKPPTSVGKSNVVSHIVTYVRGSDVDTVIINGRIVVMEGRVLTVNEEEVLIRAREEALRLWEAIRH